MHRFTLSGRSQFMVSSWAKLIHVLNFSNQALEDYIQDVIMDLPSEYVCWLWYGDPLVAVPILKNDTVQCLAERWRGASAVSNGYAVPEFFEEVQQRQLVKTVRPMWYCNECGVKGTIEYPEDAERYSIDRFLGGFHRQAAGRCAHQAKDLVVLSGADISEVELARVMAMPTSVDYALRDNELCELMSRYQFERIRWEGRESQYCAEVSLIIVDGHAVAMSLQCVESFQDDEFGGSWVLDEQEEEWSFELRDISSVREVDGGVVIQRTNGGVYTLTHSSVETVLVS